MLGLTCRVLLRAILGSEYSSGFHCMPEGKGMKGDAWMVFGQP